MKRTTSLVVLSLALLTSNVAFADGDEPTSGGGMHAPGGLLDRSPQHRNQELSFFAGVPWYSFAYGFPFGIGARYYIPILHDGFIPPVNDEFGIEFGADFTGYAGTYFSPELRVPVEVMWRFHFTPKFSAYAKLGLGIRFAFSNCGTIVNNQCAGGLYLWPEVVSDVGLFYKLSDTIDLRAEVGYPWAKVGIGIRL